MSDGLLVCLSNMAANYNINLKVGELQKRMVFNQRIGDWVKYWLEDGTDSYGPDLNHQRPMMMVASERSCSKRQLST